MPAFAQEITPIVETKINYQNSIALAANTQLRIDQKRDIYRHPVETLAFFGIKPSDKVIEIWPGQGWYSSILGPYLKSGNGQLIAAHFDVSTTNSQLVKDLVDNYRVKYSQDADKYGNVTMVSFGPRSGNLGEKNSVDAVLTFRNIHNWMSQGWADKAFDDFFAVLKPGGILGIEEHRADDDSPQDPLAADGYVREDYVIDMALDAGFEFVGASNINANPKDTKDHPFGVWTLPPVSRSAPQGMPANPNFDHSKYLAIGESDRMTLLFRKPIPPTPIISAEKINKFNPVKVIFGNQKPKTETKKAVINEESEEARQVLAAKDVTIKPPILSPATEIKTEPKAEVKPEAKTEIKTEIKPPIIDKTLSISVPVKFDTKPKNSNIKSEVKTEIKPPIIDAPPVKSQELPDFTLPDWADVKNPAPLDEKTEPKKLEQKKPDEIKAEPKKTEKPKVAPKNAKTEAPKTNKKPAISSSKTETKAKTSNPVKTDSKKAETAKTASKTLTPKTDGKPQVKSKSNLDKKPVAKTIAKPEAKPKTVSSTKKTVNTAAKKPETKTSTKAKEKPTAKPNANIPDWKPTKKKTK